MYRKGMPLTPEEIRQAKSISLLTYLQSCGMEITRKGRYYCLKDHDSLVIYPDTNKWFWNSHGLSGHNAVDFIMAYNNRTFLEAVSELIGRSPEYSCTEVREMLSEPKIFVLPERSPNMHRLYAYLTKTRCIDAEVISHFVRNRQLYEDEHHNCVFVGYDGTGQPAYAFQRGTLTTTQYRGECPYSDKRFSFCHSGESNRLYVFEAAIDLLSYLTLYPDWSSSYLSLGGLNDVPLISFLTSHPIEEINLCLDNDVPGILAAERLRRKYGEKYTVSILVPGSADQKDWNARLVYERQGLLAPTKVSLYKGRTHTLLVFSSPDVLREYVAQAENMADSILLVNNNTEDAIAAFKVRFQEERHLTINNTQFIPTLNVGQY